MAGAPAITGFLFHVSELDTALALPLATVGFIATFVQATRAKSKAEAARLAAIDAQSRMSRNHMLVLLPQLQRIEDDLDTAIKDKEVKLVLHYLSNWRWQTGQAKQILENESQPNLRAIKAMNKSIALATRTKLDIVAAASASSSEGFDLTVITRSLSESIAAVTSEMGALAQAYARDGKEAQ